MATITLKTGEVAIVDDDLHLFLSRFRWHRTCKGYAATCLVPGSTIFMHRVINGTRPGQQTDHINGDKLDNRRENLRSCSNAENCRTRRRSNPSGFRGVNQRPNGKWEASICFDYRRHYLGVYDSKEEASAAYAGAAKVLYGEFQPIDSVQEVA